MSTSEPNLTQDEQILHHLAAMLKNKLEAYRVSASGDERAWRNAFRALLVCLAIHFYNPSRPSFRENQRIIFSQPVAEVPHLAFTRYC